ncbi:hypothetical protein M752DRAFT_307687 [Aspergillus phoenicis ATCC 13157]|uniref:Zn(2)-C6 fungal-type domain-containing protein n=1 Tax=Aspergillus phoenicis ATCC 13157 TaxID=1353007 RepID=A0A370P881_ASPPH|nr:hypothetical protein M752DRAFT_307687 [Aspergillus phoenicis ATCC 13157]
MALADPPHNGSRTVCVNCKLQKKKCDKMSPRCGQCVRKKVECRYGFQDTEQTSFPVRPFLAGPIAYDPTIQSSRLLSDTFSNMLISEPATIESALYLQVYRILRATGQNFDDVKVRYFRGMHTFLPIISPECLNYDLGNSQFAPPPTSVSILLLSMCLITYHPEFSYRQDIERIDQASLYLTTKSLFTQVQSSSPDSLRLIQAGIIIAIYEYSSGRNNDAFATIGYCARMGISSRLHLTTPFQATGGPTAMQEEESNTHWGIFISRAPEIQVELMTESDDLYLSDLLGSKRLPRLPGDTLSKRGGFASIARAAWLLDQALMALSETDQDLRIARLKNLDYILQKSLAVGLNQAGGDRGSWCTGNAINMRTLFIIHRHIVDQLSAPTVTEREIQNTYTALDTITMMMVDIAATQDGLSLVLIDTLPSNVSYVIQAALAHLRDNHPMSDKRIHAENQLRRTLGILHKRWKNMS